MHKQPEPPSPPWAAWQATYPAFSAVPQSLQRDIVTASSPEGFNHSFCGGTRLISDPLSASRGGIRALPL